jgi:hypothetical protein
MRCRLTSCCLCSRNWAFHIVSQLQRVSRRLSVHALHVALQQVPYDLQVVRRVSFFKVSSRSGANTVCRGWRDLASGAAFTRHVTGSINDAIQEAQPGDTVIIPSGFYNVRPAALCQLQIVMHSSSDRQVNRKLCLAQETVLVDRPLKCDATSCCLIFVSLFWILDLFVYVAPAGAPA